MAVFIWLLIGVLSTIALMYFYHWAEDKSSIDISPNIVLAVIFGAVFGIFTTALAFIGMIIIASENEKIAKWFDTSFKSIKIKKDKENDQ